MPDWSRRRALQAVAATGAVALAGCSGSTSSSSSVPRERGDSVSDVTVQFARHRDGQPFYHYGDDDSDQRASRMMHLTSQDDRERLRFRSTDPATELRSLVDGTDLESESVFLLVRPVGECYELLLRGVYREPDGVEADFCQTLRPADVECSADDEDLVGVAIRLPFPGDDFNSHGSSWSSTCESPRYGTPIAREGGDEA
jgi:hypothetical protein